VIAPARDRTHFESPIWIGNDHGGVELKHAILEHLDRRGMSTQNVGSDSAEIVRYPLFAQRVAGAVSRGEIRRGILICSTGIGMSIIANKFAGVRASLCTSAYMGKMTRAHNDSNVLCLGAKITSTSDALEIVDQWLDTPFEGGRHCISLDLIRQGEDLLLNRTEWNPVSE
jgi:ribose 5-phosphate isomerase B